MWLENKVSNTNYDIWKEVSEEMDLVAAWAITIINPYSDMLEELARKRKAILE